MAKKARKLGRDHTSVTGVLAITDLNTPSMDHQSQLLAQAFNVKARAFWSVAACGVKNSDCKDWVKFTDVRVPHQR